MAGVFVRVVTLAGAVFYLAAGAWAFADPRSFYDELATFPPYNRHLLHDIGAFQIGLGAALLLAGLGLSALRAVLWAIAAGSVLHAISHIVDSDLGGRGSDPYLLSVFAALFVIAALLVSKVGGVSGAGSGP